MTKKDEQWAWWEHQGSFKEIASAAYRLLTYFYPDPQTRIVCLGQSPAWITKAAEALSKQRGENRTFEYVAFSDNFYRRTNDLKTEEAEYHKCSYIHISGEQIKGYRDYLRSKHCDPHSLIKHFNETGQQTVIIDYAEMGNSLASFVAFLFSWAKEDGVETELKKSLDIHVLSNGYNYLREINIPVEGISVQCKPHPVERDVMYALTLSEADRIVPEYSYKHWGSAPGPVKNDSALVADLEQKVPPAAAQYEQEMKAWEQEKRDRRNAAIVLATTQWELYPPAAPKVLATKDSRVSSDMLKLLGVDAVADTATGTIQVGEINQCYELSRRYNQIERSLKDLIPDETEQAAAVNNISAQIRMIEESVRRMRTSRYNGV